MRGLRFAAYLAPTILLWGATPLVVAELGRTLPVLWTNTYTSLAATVTLALLVAIRAAALRGGGPPRRYAAMAVLGVTGLYPYIMLLFAAYTLAPSAAGEVNIVNYTWPVWVVLLSALRLGETLGARRLAGLAAGFAGAALVITGGSLGGFREANHLAFLCAAAGAFFWAWYSVRGKELGLEPLVATAVSFAAATVCFAVTALIFAPFRLPGPRETALIVLLGAGGNGVGYLLWSLALRSAPSERVTGAVYLTPFVALAYLWIFGRAAPRWYQLVALLMVVGGALAQRWKVRGGPAAP